MPFLISTNCSLKQERAVGTSFCLQLASGQHHFWGSGLTLLAEVQGAGGGGGGVAVARGERASGESSGR